MTNSRCSLANTRCGACGLQLPEDPIYHVIFDDDPVGLVQRVKDGTINTISCQYCGYEGQVKVPFLYVSTRLNFMAFVRTEQLFPYDELQTKRRLIDVAKEAARSALDEEVFLNMFDFNDYSDICEIFDYSPDEVKDYKASLKLLAERSGLTPEGRLRRLYEQAVSQFREGSAGTRINIIFYGLDFREPVIKHLAFILEHRENLSASGLDFFSNMASQLQPYIPKGTQFSPMDLSDKKIIGADSTTVIDGLLRNRPTEDLTTSDLRLLAFIYSTIHIRSNEWRLPSLVDYALEMVETFARCHDRAHFGYDVWLLYSLLAHGYLNIPNPRPQMAHDAACAALEALNEARAANGGMISGEGARATAISFEVIGEIQSRYGSHQTAVEAFRRAAEIFAQLDDKPMTHKMRAKLYDLRRWGTSSTPSTIDGVTSLSVDDSRPEQATPPTAEEIDDTWGVSLGRYISKFDPIKQQIFIVEETAKLTGDENIETAPIEIDGSSRYLVKVIDNGEIKLLEVNMKPSKPVSSYKTTISEYLGRPRANNHPAIIRFILNSEETDKLRHAEYFVNIAEIDHLLSVMRDCEQSPDRFALVQITVAVAIVDLLLLCDAPFAAFDFLMTHREVFDNVRDKDQFKMVSLAARNVFDCISRWQTFRSSERKEQVLWFARRVVELSQFDKMGSLDSIPSPRPLLLELCLNWGACAEYGGDLNLAWRIYRSGAALANSTRLRPAVDWDEHEGSQKDGVLLSMRAVRVLLKRCQEETQTFNQSELVECFDLLEGIRARRFLDRLTEPSSNPDLLRSPGVGVVTFSKEQATRLYAPTPPLQTGKLQVILDEHTLYVQLSLVQSHLDWAGFWLAIQANYRGHLDILERRELESVFASHEQLWNAYGAYMGASSEPEARAAANMLIDVTRYFSEWLFCPPLQATVGEATVTDATIKRFIISPEAYTFEIPFLGAMALRESQTSEGAVSSSASVVVCPNGGAYRGGDKLAYKDVQRVDVFINPSGDLGIFAERAFTGLQAVCANKLGSVFKRYACTAKNLVDSLLAADVVVYFGHGVWDETLGSGLVLSFDDIFSGRDLDAIDASQLKAKLVVIINCWGGRVETSTQFMAREINGLTPSLRRHGVGCVLGSLWPLSAHVGAAFLPIFFNTWKSAPTVSEAVFSSIESLVGGDLDRALSAIGLTVWA